MGVSCSKACYVIDPSASDKALIKNKSSQFNCHGHLNDVHDQQMHQLMKRSIDMYANQRGLDDDGCVVAKESATPAAVKRCNLKTVTNSQTNDLCLSQYHLLFKQQQKSNNSNNLPPKSSSIPMPFHDKENSLDKQGGGAFKDTNKKTNDNYDVNGRPTSNANQQSRGKVNMYPTRLVIKRQPVRPLEEGIGGTHIYAVRWPAGKTLATGQEGTEEDDGNKNKYLVAQQEQFPRYRSDRSNNSNNNNMKSIGTSGTVQSTVTMTQQKQQPNNFADNNKSDFSAVKSSPPTVLSLAADVDDPSSMTASVDHLFQPSAMCTPPRQKVLDWVTVSAEHNVFVADVGLNPAECDRIVAMTEQVCRGQYAAYTYAKQTLGCREFPELAEVVQHAVHTITHAILEFSATNPGNGNTKIKHTALALDDREPHMVKYDVTKKERQKLDMHTDKSEWTFLMSLSNGCGLDYTGGGTYFECLDSTIHIQRGHALVFPGKLRHCGQRISSGLRFLLVGFLVDKSPVLQTNNNNNSTVNGKDQVKDANSSAAVEPSFVGNDS